MKTKIFSKVMILLMAFLVCNMPSVKAQDVQMATLDSGDTTQVFYGAGALKNAYDAANDGDLITLSAGTFNSCNINKGVKIYGAGGFTQDVEHNRYKTIINGDFTIELKDGAKGFWLEGIRANNTISGKGTIEEMMFKRNSLNSLNLSNATVINSSIINCHISNFYPDSKSQNLTLSNCVYMFSGSNSSEAVLNILNCVQLSNGGYNRPTACVYKNCIIVNNSTSPNLILYNTAYTNYGYILSNDVLKVNSIYLGKDRNNLGDFGIFGDNYYDLTEEWKEKLIGDDGTEMGIYGGMNPFTSVPSNPQVVSKEVAKQSDAEGKLSVKIVVEAQK